MALFKNSKEVAYVIFNGINSTMSDWFAKARLLSSSWNDLTTTTTTNYFSMAGQ
jgi:hypothetical protein